MEIVITREKRRKQEKFTGATKKCKFGISFSPWDDLDFHSNLWNPKKSAYIITPKARPVSPTSLLVSLWANIFQRTWNNRYYKNTLCVPLAFILDSSSWGNSNRTICLFDPFALNAVNVCYAQSYQWRHQNEAKWHWGRDNAKWH